MHNEATGLGQLGAARFLARGWVARPGGHVFEHEVDAMRTKANYIWRIRSTAPCSTSGAVDGWTSVCVRMEAACSPNPTDQRHVATFAKFADPRLTGPLEELMGERPVLLKKSQLQTSASRASAGLKSCRWLTNHLRCPSNSIGAAQRLCVLHCAKLPARKHLAVVLDDCTVENRALIMWPVRHHLDIVCSATRLRILWRVWVEC